MVVDDVQYGVMFIASVDINLMKIIVPGVHVDHRILALENIPMLLVGLHL